MFAPAIAGCPRVRVSRDGGLNYPARWERKLTGARPAEPAAVRVYSPERTARALVGDFDVKRAGQPRAEADAAAFVELVEACGGRAFTDRSPAGGLHVYVLWAAPLGAAVLRPVVRALEALFPSFDARPMLGVAQGCIRPPGAAHPAGGHQELATPMGAALEAVSRPNGPVVWERLCERLSPQLDAVDGDAAAAELGPEFAAALSLRIDRAPVGLGPEHEQIARSGQFDRQRYRSPSEARQGVIASAAARGHRFVDVVRRIETGAWAGLAAMYDRYGSAATGRSDARRRIRTALARDWREAHRYATQGAKPHLQNTQSQEPKEESVRKSHTRGNQHSPPRDLPQQQLQNPPTGQIPTSERPACYLATEYQFLRSWWSAARAAEHACYASRSGLSVRLVLRALAAAAQIRGSRHVQFGTRSLALACGLDHSTVAAVLRRLRAETDPLIDLVEGERGVHGDLYELRVPVRYREVAAWRHWRAGKFGVHPVFRALGPVAAFVYEELDAHPRQVGDLRRAACVSASAAHQALTELASFGLAENTGAGWRRGSASPAAVADALGVTEVIEALITRYRVERAAWRAVLGAVPSLTVADIVAAGPLTEDQHGPAPPLPEPPPEEPETVMELLWRALGAVPIPD